MNDKDWKATAKKIFFKREGLENERKALNDEISAVRTNVREGLVDDKVQKKAVQQMFREELHKEGYRKVINGKIKDLKTMEADLINETGEFNAKQLSIFDVKAVRKEFEETETE